MRLVLSEECNLNIEDLKQQARLLVRWHRERNYSVGGRIRNLPRYHDLTDVEALSLKFPLSEAQEIIARQQEEGLLSAFLEVDNVKDLFAEYKATGVPFAHPLRKQPCGGTAFTVLDPDGNCFCFVG